MFGSAAQRNYGTLQNGHSSSTVDVWAESERQMRSGSTVSFHALSYFVNADAINRRCCCSCCAAPKQILHDLSGIFRPGMNAIMGSTGSGKTSLLDTLAGCVEENGVEGTILVDGQRRPKSFKFMTGYVVQDDVVMGTLTVRENLMFSANLRLPNSLSQEDKRQRVEDIVQELGLTVCADTKVGTEFIRGVSGGERKRTNIGMELIISPGILFLDEPTTGLDSSTANAVMSLLHRLSRRGRTVIFSIHQPRFTIFQLFDRLSLLAKGRPVFHGPAEEALSFCQSVGYECDDHNNPPDFFLDVMNGDSTAVQALQDYQYSVNDMRSSTNDTSLAEALSAKFSASTWDKQTTEELRQIMSTFVSTSQNSPNESSHYVTSFLTQLRHVSKRTFLNVIRNPAASMLQVFIAVCFAVLVGIICWQVDSSYPAGLQNRTGAMFLVILYQLFCNISALEVFIQERVVFIHESARGFYRVSTYFFSKIFCDFIPMRFVPLCPFSVITYFMIGFQLDAARFFKFFLALFLTTMSGAAVCFVVSATVRVFAVANLLTAFVFVLMTIFGGLLINITAVGDWLSWLQYLSIIRYSFNVLAINELDGLTFYRNGTKIPYSGSVYLTEQGIDHETEWDFWKNVMALGVIAVGLMLLAYIQLRRIKKLK